MACDGIGESGLEGLLFLRGRNKADRVRALRPDGEQCRDPAISGKSRLPSGIAASLRLLQYRTGCTRWEQCANDTDAYGSGQVFSA
jgi:hypothetical protein